MADMEPVAYQYLFTSPFGDGDVWRDSSRTWNGQSPKQSRPLFTANQLEQARQEERDACEKECEIVRDMHGAHGNESAARGADQCLEAIRARGEKTG